MELMTTTHVPISGSETLLMPLLSQLEIGYVTYGGVVPSNMCILSREEQLKVKTLLHKTSL